MNPELEFKTEEDRIKFEQLLQQAFSNISNYEKQSIEVILNLYKSLKELKDNKLRMTKYMVEDIDKLISLIRVSEGKPEDQKKMMDEIKALQSNISKYMETSDEEIYDSIRRNIDEINKLNQQLITNKQGYVSDEDKITQEKEKQNELRYLSERQNKLHQILDSEIKKELRKLKANSKPFDFQKLDKAYRNLYVALEKEDKEEIIQKRGRLIRLLEANKKEINKQYEELKALEEIKEVFESEEAQEIKLQRINEILRRAENTNYAYYFNNISNYDELRKEFYNLYEFLEVNKTRLYKEALKQELKRHGEEIKEAYNTELIDKKHQASVLTQALPMTMGLSIQKLSNTMGELRNATTDRQRAELRKEAVKDLGRIVVTPVANIAKFTANNWYTLSLLHKGYNTAKAKAEAEEKARQEAEQARREAEQAQEEQQETPEHIGAEYDDPEFEEEVTRLMKTGEFQSVDEAEHQALINLGRIPPDEPEAQEETPDDSRELTGRSPMVLNPELQTEFETREEAIEYLIGQNSRLTRKMAEKIVDTGIEKGTIQIGDGPRIDLPNRRIPIRDFPRPGESEDQEPGPEEIQETQETVPDNPEQIEGEPEQSEELQEQTPDNSEPVAEDPTPEPAQELSEVQEKLNVMAAGETVILRDNMGGGTYEVVKNEDGTFNVTVYGVNGEISQTLENLRIDLFGSAFEIAPVQEIPTPEVPEQNEEEQEPDGPRELTGRSPMVLNPELQTEFENREDAIEYLMGQNSRLTREMAEKIVDTGIEKGTIVIGNGPRINLPNRRIPIRNIPRPGESENEEPEQNEELQEPTPDNPEPAEEVGEIAVSVSGLINELEPWQSITLDCEDGNKIIITRGIDGRLYQQTFDEEGYPINDATLVEDSNIFNEGYEVSPEALDNVSVEVPAISVVPELQAGEQIKIENFSYGERAVVFMGQDGKTYIVYYGEDGSLMPAEELTDLNDIKGFTIIGEGRLDLDNIQLPTAPSEEQEIQEAPIGGSDTPPLVEALSTFDDLKPGEHVVLERLGEETTWAIVTRGEDGKLYYIDGLRNPEDFVQNGGYIVGDNVTNPFAYQPLDDPNMFEYYYVNTTIPNADEAFNVSNVATETMIRNLQAGENIVLAYPDGNGVVVFQRDTDGETLYAASYNAQNQTLGAIPTNDNALRPYRDYQVLTETDSPGDLQQDWEEQEAARAAEEAATVRYCFGLGVTRNWTGGLLVVEFKDGHFSRLYRKVLTEEERDLTHYYRDGQVDYLIDLREICGYPESNEHIQEEKFAKY